MTTPAQQKKKDRARKYRAKLRQRKKDAEKLSGSAGWRVRAAGLCGFLFTCLLLLFTVVGAYVSAVWIVGLFR